MYDMILWTGKSRNEHLIQLYKPHVPSTPDENGRQVEAEYVWELNAYGNAQPVIHLSNHLMQPSCTAACSHRNINNLDLIDLLEGTDLYGWTFTKWLLSESYCLVTPRV